MNRENDTEEIIVDVTEEEYKSDLAHGLHEDEVMKAGRHKFIRGGFLTRHGITSDPAKIRISVDIDINRLNDFKHQTSSIKHQTSSIKHRTSNIQHQASSIKHQTSNIKHQASNIKHQTSGIKHQTSSSVSISCPSSLRIAIRLHITL